MAGEKACTGQARGHHSKRCPAVTEGTGDRDTEAGKVTISRWLESAFSFFPDPEDNGILGQVECPRKLDSSHINLTSVT